MAKGKYAKSRTTPKREVAEIEQAFREVSKQKEPPVVKPKEPKVVPAKEPTPVKEIEYKEITPAMARNKKIILIALCVLAVAVVVGAVVTVSFLFNGLGDDGLILNNVHVAGVNVGGMTMEEAEKAIHAATDLTYTGKDMVVTLPGTTITLSPANTGAKLDVYSAVEAAFSYGRTGSKAEQEAARQHVLTGEYNIALLPYLSLNTSYIRQQVESYAASFSSTYVPSSYAVEGERPALDLDHYNPDAPNQILVLNVGAPGRHVDANALYNRILDAYSFNTFNLDATDGAPDEEPEKLNLEAIFAEICVAPVNATMDMETFAVTPEIYGYGFNVEEVQALLDAAEPGSTLRVEMDYIDPAVPGSALKEGLFEDVLAECETKHTNNENRNNNLRLACAAIDGYILMPGDVFSYNDVLGERTAEAGYKPAAAYSGMETVYELGGGICQVSSTLYYCVFFADLEVVIRGEHTFASSYIDLGMDATVSWGGPEFKFANNTEYPIRIEAKVEDGLVKVKIRGTETKDYRIGMDMDILSYTPYKTIYEEFPKENEKNYVEGQIIVTPYDGYVVRTWKLYLDPETGEEISRKEMYISRYASRDMVIAKIVEETTDPTDPSGEATEPGTTEPGVTDPSVTDPPATDPPATDPPATDPPVTDPPVTDPPATDPPATDPPVTDPPATDPPVTDPPATDPPATQPPATEPPAPPAGEGTETGE